MKVIFLADVPKVGRKFDVKNVSDGYAMNFLFARKLAEPATEKRLKEIEEMHQKKQAEIAALEEISAKKMDTLRGAKIEIKTKATPKGGLFKGVDRGAIVRAIREQKSLEIDPELVLLDHPLKTTGEHEVTLKGKTKKAALTVVITASL